MIRVLFGAVLLLGIGLPNAASADGDPVIPGPDHLLTHVEDGVLGSESSGGSGSGLPSCAETDLGQPCRIVTICVPTDRNPLGGTYVLMTDHSREFFGWCVPESATEDRPTVTPARILDAFRRVPLPSTPLVVQPPGGKTLVNFDTIFSTEAEPFTRTVRLLGHEVVLKVRASSFSWRFGDGSKLVTSEPGRTYRRGLPMDSYITHRYTDAGVTVHPRVDTTYSAEYSVDGGPFQPVIGTVTIEGESARLEIIEARPVLTGGR